MKKSVFLSLAEVLEIHSSQVSRYGGKAGIRDLKLLDSALAMPEASFEGEYLHNDLFEMAAAYAFHICQNQPFWDGNKRTALNCALVFLKLNGIALHDPKGLFYRAMMDVSYGKMGKKELASLFRKLHR